MPKTTAVRFDPNENHASGGTKRSIYGWKAVSDRGEFMWLDKRLLNIDHNYQREQISKSRIYEIARNWSWQAFGVILVFLRESNGRHYVYDGQHRVLASLKRDDVQELPCFVFVGESVAQEASGYVAANTVRGPMQALEKFKARVVAEDPNALSIKACLEEWGYQLDVSEGQGKVACINCMEAIYVKDVGMFRRVLATLARLAEGGTFRNRIFSGLAYVDEHMRRHRIGDIGRRDVQEKLSLLGLRALEEAGRRYSNLAGGKGGAKVWAAGIVVEINKGRRTNRLPAVFGD